MSDDKQEMVKQCLKLFLVDLLLWIVGCHSHLNEEVFATITVKLKEETWSASRVKTAFETLGNALQTKELKTRVH